LQVNRNELSELPAEQKSEKVTLILLFMLLGFMRSYYKKKQEALAVGSKGIGLEVDGEKLSTWSCLEIRMRDEVNIKIDNSTFERVEHLTYWGANITNQNSIQERNKCRLKSQNVCYCSVSEYDKRMYFVKQFIFTKEISVLARSNVTFYHTARELTLVAK